MKTLGLKCVASGLGLMLCGVSIARAQEQIHITPPSVGSVEPISPIGGKAVGALSPVEVKTNSIVDAMLAKMRARELTPQDAWQSGVLTVDDLLYLIENKVDTWGGFFWEKNDNLRRDLVQLLVQHGADKLNETDKLSPKIRLWLADYYVSLDDEQGLQLGENLLKELIPKAKDNQSLIFLTVERMAWFHQNRREYEKAAQTWLRLEPLLTAKDWMLADAIWLAGRNTLYAGDEAKAQKYFEQAKTFDLPLYGMLVDYDLSGLWMKRGQPERVQQMQQKALESETDPVNRASRFLTLSQALYKMGEWDKAADAAQQVLAESAKEANPNPYLGAEFTQNAARDLMKWSALWQKTPAICMPQELKWHVDKNANANKSCTLSARLTIRTAQETELKVSASDERVKWKIIAPEKDPWIGGRASSDYVERWIEVEVPSDLPKAQTLKIEMPKLKNHSIAVPLKIEE